MREIIAAAFKGDFEARQELYFWAYLWPRLKKEFLEGGLPLESGSAARPSGLSDDLVSALAMTALGPQPEPPDLPAASQRVAVAALTKYRKSLFRLADEAGEEMDSLQSSGRLVRRKR